MKEWWCGYEKSFSLSLPSTPLRMTRVGFFVFMRKMGLKYSEFLCFGELF